MDSWLSTTDLFIFGLGVDIVGAILLATSVTMSNRDINLVSTPRYGWSAPLLVSKAKDRLRGMTALVLLTVGFSCQAAGYLFTLGRGDDVATGWRRVAGGVVILMAGLLVGWLADRVVLKFGLKRGLVALSSYDIKSNQLAHPAINKLHSLGMEIWPELPAESPEQYISRVFPGVTPGPDTAG